MYLMRLLGLCIGGYPWYFIFITILILLPIGSVFFIYPFHVETDIRRGFADRNGPSLNELQRFAQFYEISMEDFEIMVVFIQSKDPENKLKIIQQVCDDIERLDEFIQTLTINSLDYGPISYSDFDSKYSGINYFFHAFKWAYDMQNFHLPNYTDPNIILSYPTSIIYGIHLPLNPHFYGAIIDKDFQLKNLPTAVQSVNTVGLFYMLDSQGFQQKLHLKAWERYIFEFSQMNNFSEHFDFQVYGDQIANSEMRRSNMQSAKYFTVGVILMIIYISFVLRKKNLRTKVVLIIAAIISPILASLAAFATIRWIGLELNSTMSLTPFLVLGLGVDDAFLIMHNWRRNNEVKSVAEKMGAVLGSIGPSISITSITNALAFGVGIASPSQMMSMFCLSTSLAMIYDYIFELTIFTPFLVIVFRKNSNVLNAIEDKENLDWMSFWSSYAKLIVSFKSRAIVFIGLICLYILSTIGISRMQVTFDPSKSFSDDSPLLKTFLIADSIYKEYAPINFIVSTPPNISDTVDYEKFMNMVEWLENQPESYGRERTILWLRDYETYYRKRMASSANDTQTVITYDYVAEFLQLKMMADKNIVRYHTDENGTFLLDGFVFAVVCRGKDGWNQRARLAVKVRKFLSGFPEYNISCFDYDGTIFDLITKVQSEAYKSVFITMVCMTVVCLIFIPHIISVITALFSVSSIAFCLFGILSWWGMDFDPITMINLLMAIGFSVDSVAHICYHFYIQSNSEASISANVDSSAMIAKVLNAVGKPMIEAAISTTICILPLFSLSAYAITAFAKSVFLVVVLGILHGLVILPSIFSLKSILEVFKRTKRNRNDQQAEKQLFLT